MTMFQQGQQADPALSEGTFLAYLLPPTDDGDEYEWVNTAYGGAYKLYYNVFVPGARGTRRYQMNELASATFTTRSKLVSRIGAANNLAAVSDTLDLSSLKLEGFLLLKLGKKEGSQYLDVMDGSPLPRNYPIPSDIGDPRSTEVLQLATQTAPVVERVRREEIADEPPF